MRNGVSSKKQLLYNENQYSLNPLVVRYFNTNAFFACFNYLNNPWAAQIVAIGELLALPLVVLVSLMAQPRLQYVIAQDGMLPKI